MIKVEIACNSYGSCLNAIEGAGNRIELFENLTDGGCTPSAGMIRKAKTLSLPVYVMIRPRGGNFCYTNDEIDVMISDIEYCKEIGISGIVFGCLTASGKIDKALNKELLSIWNYGPATFHRAIDRTYDIIESARDIVDLGFERILSSGGAVNVVHGLDNLKSMHQQFGAHLSVMPGGGVTAGNASTIIAYTGCKEIHATCKSTSNSDKGCINPVFNDIEQHSEVQEIKRLVERLRHLAV